MTEAEEAVEKAEAFARRLLRDRVELERELLRDKIVGTVIFVVAITALILYTVCQ